MDTPPLSEIASPEIASHRGGAFIWPENSLLAIREALKWSAEQVELDVHASADGEPVVMHDATLDRTTDGQGPVVAQSWEALAQLRIRGTGGETIPHLSHAARLIQEGGQVLRLEVKADAQGRPYPGLVARCAAVVDQHGMRARTVFMSFEAASVAEAAALGGFAQTVWLAGGWTLRGMRPRDTVAMCRSCGATELGVPEGLADATLRDALRAEGLRLSVWGANHAPTLHRALRLGVDVIATDDPPLAIRLRASGVPAAQDPR
ncbi:glycerophosphodiester phosphodiesterase [Roseococcus thiosulfatophilus]|uniref:glycerophosphodiester phosphodiesterase n=1 Tax=Roseococcus thiosulfatophilus TaxID=35813 RepID=UPI001A8C7A60|nr:glycerophosphodiester phosphodiesterase family protein [Roseococcus thiosulfatophilus]